MKDLRILVSNDDGIDSPGIYALVQAMRSIGHVDVVAPDTQQSAVGHALTVADPLRVEKHERMGEFFGWAVNGKPADCVKLAVKKLLPEPPDIVVSGVNHGRNTAISLIYSGTVSAATEATVLGIPSIAFSLDDFSREADFSEAARVAAWLTPIVAERGLPQGVLLNVNIPRTAPAKGIKVAPQGESFWDDHYEERFDPYGRPYYWLSGSQVKSGPEECDDLALDTGHITITPIHYRLTDWEMLEALKSWDLESRDGATNGFQIQSAESKRS